MKHRRITSVCAGLVLASVLASIVWAGPAIQEPAVTYGFGAGGEFCSSSTILDFEIKGNKTFLKLHNEGEMISEDSRLTGHVIVDVEVFINNVNGHINARGSLILQPHAHAGIWEGDFNIHVPGGQSIDVNGIMIVKDSQMNARGTGEFDGQWFFFSHGIADSGLDQVPVEGPEGCEFSGEIWTGTILNPNAT